MSWKKGQRKGVLPKPCLRCGTGETPTKHHVFPKRHFDPDGPTVPFCRSCHDKLEWLIPLAVQHHNFYWEIIHYFVDVSEWKLEQDLEKVQHRRFA